MTTQRPNILLITTDQHHYNALGLRTPELQTPHLDRLAAQGAVFDRAYCPNPLCSPSRSSIITGKYPSAHGCWTIGTKLDEESQTVGELLGHAGYATSLIGKAHFQPLKSTPDQTSLECPPVLRDLDFWRSFNGPWYGFDHIELARNHADEAWAGQHYGIWLEEQGLANWQDYFQGPDTPKRQHSWELPSELHYSTWTASRSIAAIERAAAAESPFFCWASFQDPHPPYLVPEPWASMYDPAAVTPGQLVPGELDRMPPWHRLTQESSPDFAPWRETQWGNHGFHSHRIDEELLRRNLAVYYGMISLIDEQVGRILDRLDTLGIAESTVVVFTTDHGHFLGQHGLIAKGAFHYDDLLRIPMIVRYPGRVAAGTQTAALQSLVDLAPTFLSAAGAPVPLDMQGVDQLPVWTGAATSARDHVIVENRHQPTAVHLRTYIEDRHKLTVYRDQPWGEFFDLAEDPGEVCNRYDDPDYESVRGEVMRRFLGAELAREASPYARIAGA